MWPMSSTRRGWSVFQGILPWGMCAIRRRERALTWNAQPILVDCWRGPIALAHNGNLTNALHLRRELERDGAIFHSTSDSEVILHLISRSRRRTLQEAFVEALRMIQGAYSLVF